MNLEHCCGGVALWFYSSKPAALSVEADATSKSIEDGLASTAASYSASIASTSDALASTVASSSASIASTSDDEDISALSQALTVVGAMEMFAFCVPSSILRFRGAATLFRQDMGLFPSDDVRNLVNGFLSQSIHKTLHDAAEAGEIESLWSHVYVGAHPDAIDKYGCTALQYVADQSKTAACKLLLAAKADLHIQHRGLNIRAGWTPLHFAAYSGSRDIAFLLLLAGAEVNQLDKCRRTPLYYAENRGKHGVARLLKKFGGLEDTHLVRDENMKEALLYNDGEHFQRQDSAPIQWDASADAADMYSGNVVAPLYEN